MEFEHSQVLFNCTVYDGLKSLSRICLKHVQYKCRWRARVWEAATDIIKWKMNIGLGVDMTKTFTIILRSVLEEMFAFRAG